VLGRLGAPQSSAPAGLAVGREVDVLSGPALAEGLPGGLEPLGVALVVRLPLERVPVGQLAGHPFPPSLGSRRLTTLCTPVRRYISTVRLRPDDGFTPCPELIPVLEPAFSPCSGFAGGCVGVARWCPSAGHVPRGCTGAFGTVDEVELVLVTAEPGDPLDGEVHQADESAEKMIAEVSRYVYAALETQATQYHRNLRSFSASPGRGWTCENRWPGLGLPTRTCVRYQRRAGLSHA